MFYRDFITQKPEFSVDGVSLEQLGQIPYSPIYVTSLSAVEQRIIHYKKALDKHFPGGKIHYAIKANFGIPLLEQIRQAGGAADIVSLGELRQALKAGFAPKDICFAGVGKTKEELEAAIAHQVGMINVEHTDELQWLLSQPLPHTGISLRLNPAVEVDTHPHLKTGAIDSKFGLLLDEIKHWFSTHPMGPHMLRPLVGIHVHVGSQLMDTSLFPLVMEQLCLCAQFLISQGAPICHFDLGGGLGVGIDGSPMDHSDIYKHVDFLSKHLLEQGKRHHLPPSSSWSVALEPGRSVVASSTVLLTKVLYTRKRGDNHNFAYVDAGMNDFLRPMLYGAEHPCVRVFSAKGENTQDQGTNADPSSHIVPPIPYQVVGPICESSDVLRKSVLLPPLSPNDVLCFFEAGAYCRSMASHYNLRPLTAEVYCRGGKIVHISPALCPE